MANQTYLPKRDQDLLDFAINMNTKIAVDPTTWGLTLAQQTAFGTLVTTFEAAMTTLQDPLTRSTPYVVAKNDARDLLINDENGIRKLVDIIQVFPGTTNQMRSEINITIRDTTNTPVPPPSTMPVVTVTSVNDHTVHFYLRDIVQPDQRAKPEGVTGAYIKTYVGDTPPEDFSQWTFQKTVTRTTDSVTFSAEVEPLAKVWIAATWVNAKGQTGPFSTAVWTNLGGGVSSQAA